MHPQMNTTYGYFPNGIPMVPQFGYEKWPYPMPRPMSPEQFKVAADNYARGDLTSEMQNVSSP
jgi:hypothetical protein